MIYTGIGSRKAPQHILNKAEEIGYYFARKGFTLRSGKARGMDAAFQTGMQNFYLDSLPDLLVKFTRMAEIYIPWETFDNPHLMSEWDYTFETEEEYLKCEEIAKTIHPAWMKCSPAAKKLHSRNVFQILGFDLDTPSDFVLYWAEEDSCGEVSGGTRTAVMLARKYNIPTINMDFEGWEEKLREVIKQ